MIFNIDYDKQPLNFLKKTRQSYQEKNPRQD